MGNLSLVKLMRYLGVAILLIIDISVIVTGQSGTVIFFTLFFSLGLIWVMLFPNIGSKLVTTTEDGFYFKRESEIIEYKDVEAIEFDFSIVTMGARRRTFLVYSTNLRIEIKGKKLGVFLREETNLESYWPIIEAFREYNYKYKNAINFGPHIPETEEELEIIIDGWKLQRESIVEDLKKQSVERYAEDNDLSKEEAELKVQKEKKKVIKFISIFIFIMFVISFFLN